MNKNLSKMMILHSHMGCYIDVYLHWRRYTIIAQNHWVSFVCVDII